MSNIVTTGAAGDDYFFYDRNNPESMAKAAKAMSDNIDAYDDSVFRAKASLYSRQTFTNIDTKTSIRPEFNRRDYEYFRPGERLPQRAKESMEACNYYYWNVGIIKNIIDLMADFACQGIAVQHPNPKSERMFQRWFKDIVNGPERSERFLNTYYRLGNVVVRRLTGKLTLPDAKKLEKVQAAADKKIDISKLDLGRRTVPYLYAIMNPLSLEVVGGDVCCFTGKYHYEMVLPMSMTSIVRKHASARNVEEQRAVEELDPFIRDAIERGLSRIPLDSNEIRVFHYKKDDWQVWATPFIHCILEDIILLQKTKLCDLAALDGAISSVRLWNLGSLDHQLAPAPGAANRLARMLENNTGGGVVDIIWGPDLKMTESNSNIHQFLGEGKYKAVLQNIYAGLGVPPTLTGSATASGFTNNYISLKTLVERLEYGRAALQKFWEYEFAIFQKAMGYQKPAMLRFDRMTLSDEAAERALLIQLLDRQVISDETVLERFSEIPKLEKARIKREVKEKDTKKMPPKAGAFHNPQTDVDLKKIALQSGQVTPSQVGIELDPKKKGEVSVIEMEQKQAQEQHNQQMQQLDKQHTMQIDKSNHDMKHKNKDMEVMDKKMQVTDKNMEHTRLQIEKMKHAPKGTPGQGRPKNSKDSKKRKTKTVKPRKSVKAEENHEKPTEGV